MNCSCFNLVLRKLRQKAHFKTKSKEKEKRQTEGWWLKIGRANDYITSFLSIPSTQILLFDSLDPYRLSSNFGECIYVFNVFNVFKTFKCTINHFAFHLSKYLACTAALCGMRYITELLGVVCVECCV